MLLQLYVQKDSWDINVPLIGSAGTVMSHNKTNRKKLFFYYTFSIRNPVAIALEKIINTAKT